MYICNNRSLFLDLRRFEKLGVVRTGGGPVKLQGIGTVKVEFFTGFTEGKP